MLTNFRFHVDTDNNTHSVYESAVRHLCAALPGAEQRILGTDAGTLRTVLRTEDHSWVVNSSSSRVHLLSPGDFSLDIEVTPDGRCNEINAMFCATYDHLHGTEQWFAGVMADLIAMTHPLYVIDVDPGDDSDVWSQSISVAPESSPVRRAWYDRLSRKAELESL